MSYNKNIKEHVDNIDITRVYAYLDASHARDRQLWRGFLSCVLPHILPQHSENIDKFIIDSLVDEAEELIENKANLTQINRAVHTISTFIARSIDVSEELALAAFYDNEYNVNMPTKLYKFHHIPVKQHTKIAQEENMVEMWIQRFHQVCHKRKFISYVEIWKDWLS